MAIELRPYQAAGSAWLSDRNGILAWKPGVGKTLTALDAGDKTGGKILYVCPATIRWQIAGECDRLGLKSDVIETGTGDLSLNADVVITSYELAARKHVWQKLYRGSWGALIVDEAHALKNIESKRSRAIYGAQMRSTAALYTRARRTWALTGTPILNSPMDLYPHYSRLFPFVITRDDGLPLTKGEWQDRFCAVANTGFGDKIVGGKNLDELREIMGPFVNQLNLEEALGEMPPLTIDTLPLRGEAIDVSGLDAETLAVLQKAAGRLCEDDGALSTVEPALATLRLRTAVAKAREVASLVEVECHGGADKIILFAHHKEAIEIVRATAQSKALQPVVISGAVTGRAREAALDTFRDDPKCKLAIVNIRAGGVGLNMQHANRVIFLEADWTPAMNDQAIARSFRSGQTRPVRVSFVSLKGSVDEVVTKALARKAAIIRKVLQ